MPAPISVIIPTLNAADGIGPTLGALTEGLGAGLIREVIISDGGSEDAIAGIAEAWGAEFLQGPPGRGGQLRRAAEQATGAWLLVLHADSAPAPGWTEPVLEHISHGVERAGYFDLRFDAGGLAARLVSGWANLRSRVFGLPFYAGWGLTKDRAGDALAFARRLRRLSLDELVAGTLLRYPLYWDDKLRGYTTAEAIVNHISDRLQRLESGDKELQLGSSYLRRKYDRFVKSISLTIKGMNDWRL